MSVECRQMIGYAGRQRRLQTEKISSMDGGASELTVKNCFLRIENSRMLGKLKRLFD